MEKLGRVFAIAVLLVVLWLTIMAFSGCSTIEGIGQDLGDGSRAVRSYMYQQQLARMEQEAKAEQASYTRR